MNRRSFLRQWLSWLGQATLTGWTWLGLSACRDRSPARPEAAPKAASRAPAPTPATKSLRVAEARTLEAALERLLPSGVPVGTPGARQAKVIDYLDRQLAEPHFRGFLQLLQRGAKLLEQVSIREVKGPFHSQSDAIQDAILTRFQAGTISGTRYPTQRFFAVLHSFGLEGFLGHPRYGGNADRLVWRSLGLDPHCPNAHGPKGQP